MMIKTHILDRDGRCSRCGIKLGGTELSGNPKLRAPFIGDRIGLITELRFTGDFAYLITQPKHDTNQLCEAK